MPDTEQHPTVDRLKQLSSLRDLDQSRLEALAPQLTIQAAKRKAVLLDIGATDDCTFYLLDGECRLIAEDGAEKVIRHTEPSAQAPLARLRPSHYRIVAESFVRYLRIDNALLQGDPLPAGSSALPTIEAYEVEEEFEDNDLDAENQLTLRIYEDLNSDRLLLPSLPRVAIRIGEAINDDTSDAQTIAELIETDPAIALKMVKAANSPRFGGVSQIASVVDAVARLGLSNTHLLVITFAMRELFRSDSLALQKRMLAFWEHSRKVAAVTQVLAAKVGGFNASEALLAGLIHDVGGLAVVSYAESFPAVAEDASAMEHSIAAMRSQLGGMILTRWKLPAELTTVAKEAENWYREHPGKADYADLVIVAQVHEGIAGDLDPSQVPALTRLGLAPSDVDRGLDLLNQSREEIAAAEALLSA